MRPQRQLYKNRSLAFTCGAAGAYLETVSEKMNPLALIKSVGFRRVGTWHGRDDGLDFAIDAEVRGKRWSLYAFVDGSEVLYLGKSTGPFASRLCGYRRPAKSQQTNVRVNPLILALVRAKKTIAIYHFESAGLLQFNGVTLNLAAALEDPLIAQICPKWNMNGRKALNKAPIAPRPT